MRRIIHPYVDGMFRIPTRLLEGRVDLRELKRELTVKHYDPIENVTTLVPLFQHREGGFFAVPRSFGRERFPDLWANALDRTIRPLALDVRAKDRFPIRVEARDDQQREFAGAISKFLADNVISEFQAIATTGSGKTVSSMLSVAATAIGPVGVLVQTNRLKEQWLGNEGERKGLRFLFGSAWVDKYVGVVQQDLCDFRGKRIVIMMAPSVAVRRYDPQLYKYFPYVFTDEVDTMASITMHNVQAKFPAMIHGGLTATEKTGDMGPAVSYYIGKPVITSEQRVMTPRVTRVIHEEAIDIRDWKTGEIADTAQSIINPLTRSKSRQALLADIIFVRGYLRDRQCVILSDRTAQLTDLRARLIDMGVPEEIIGLYVGEYKTGLHKPSCTLVTEEGGVIKRMTQAPAFKTKREANAYIDAWIKEKLEDAAEERTKAQRETLEWLRAGYEIIRAVKADTYSPKLEEYDDIEKGAGIFLATYQIFGRGIDVKRLNWGMEASPRADVKQPVGRVLRLDDAKEEPEWVSILDKITTTEVVTLFNQEHVRNYLYKTPLRLEKQRQASYRKHHAILKTMDNPREALEAAKKAAAAPRDQGARSRPIRPRPRAR